VIVIGGSVTTRTEGALPDDPEYEGAEEVALTVAAAARAAASACWCRRKADEITRFRATSWTR
jgi:hypothetical protein